MTNWLLYKCKGRLATTALVKQVRNLRNWHLNLKQEAILTVIVKPHVVMVMTVSVVITG